MTIDRELQAALGVDPSPEFVARVRMRIASEPPPRRWGFAWMAVAVGAAAAIVIAVVVTRSVGERKESAALLASRTLPAIDVPRSVGADLGRPRTEEAPHLQHATSPRVVTQPVRAASPTVVAIARPEILIDAREAAAIRRLISGVSAGRINLNDMLKPSPFVVADIAPVEDIEITPLSIEPLNASGEGVRQ